MQGLPRKLRRNGEWSQGFKSHNAQRGRAQALAVSFSLQLVRRDFQYPHLTISCFHFCFQDACLHHWSTAAVLASLLVTAIRAGCDLIVELQSFDEWVAT